MALLTTVLLDVVFVVVGLLVVTTPVVVGRERLAALPDHLSSRLRAALPYLVVLGVTLLVNSVARDVGPAVSWIVGWNVTGVIYSIEGPIVAVLQASAPPLLVAYLSAVYVYGYVYLLVFPVVAYLSLDDLGPLRSLALSYTFNYCIGLACYLVFVAYGPRNLLPGVESLLYANWPASQVLVSEVNTNTNVFPSLHTSLSATVAGLAYRTRAQYPLWAWVAAVGAVSVALSTMVLGIHWLTDVVAGLVLAAVSLHLADRVEAGRDRGWSSAVADLAT